jgi:hypothetical protein
MASGVYNEFKERVMEEAFHLVNDNIRVMLLDNTYTFNPDHNGRSSVSGDEISGTGYTANGELLSSKTVTEDATSNQGVFNAADVSWTSASFTARYAIIYDDSVSGDPLIACCVFSYCLTA